MKKIIFVIAAGFFGFHLFGWTQHHFEWVKIKKRVESRAPTHSNENATSNTTPLNIKLSQTAKEAKINQLVSVETIQNQGQQKVRLQWRGYQNQTLHFLSLLRQRGVVGACSELRLSQEGSSSGLLSGFALFNVATSSPSKKEIKKVAFQNAFQSPWKIKKKRRKAIVKKPSKEELERRRKEKERQEAERQERARLDRLAAKKKRLQSGWSLTGLVHNGTEALAFINQKGPGGQSRMVRQGDQIDGADITSINESKGEVHLNYQDEFDVILHLNSNL